jgi:hypothetical protein
MILLSAIFTGAVGILVLVAASVGTLDTYIGCNAKYTGVLTAWNYLDTYLTQVDKTLCSNGCPCSVTNSSLWTANDTIRASYQTWNTTGSAIAFQNCSETIQNTTLIATNATDDFLPVSFATYWSAIENKFNCSGLCVTNYLNSNNVNVTMYKYMFSGINRLVLFN